MVLDLRPDTLIFSLETKKGLEGGRRERRGVRERGGVEGERERENIHSIHGGKEYKLRDLKCVLRKHMAFDVCRIKILSARQKNRECYESRNRMEHRENISIVFRKKRSAVLETISSTS